MKNFSWLGVFLGYCVTRLPFRQVFEDRPGDLGLEPQGFQRGYDPVSAENATEPRNARIRIGTETCGTEQQMQVRSRLMEPIIKLRVGCFDQGDVFAIFLVRRLDFGKRSI